MLSGEPDTETGYKFDARLRYVENLFNAQLIFMQYENDRATQNAKPAHFQERYNRALLDLYELLALHDDTLEYPDFENITRDYVLKLLRHQMVTELSQNKVKQYDPSKAIKNKFSL